MRTALGFVTILAAGGLSAVTPAAQPAADAEAMIARVEAPQTPNRQGLDALTLAEVMRRFRVPGVSVAVIKDFQIHLAKAYGVADVERGRPVQADTLFQAASISKPVTAMAAAAAGAGRHASRSTTTSTATEVVEGAGQRIHTDQPVTPRALLSHTSGADDGFGFPGYEPGGAAADAGADPRTARRRRTSGR